MALCVYTHALFSSEHCKGGALGGGLKGGAVKPQDRKFNTLVGASGGMTSKMELQLSWGLP